MQESYESRNCTDVRRFQSVRLLLSGAFLLSSLYGAPVFAADREDVVLSYSTDNRICKPLAALYTKLNHQHIFQDDTEGGARIEINLNWEDTYPSEFISIGLQPQSPVKDASYPDDGRPTSAKWRAAFYLLYPHLNDRAQYIYAQDIPSGDHGDIYTDVWLLKSGITIPDQELKNPSNSLPPGVDAKDIEIGVLFGKPRPPQEGYPAIVGYYPPGDASDHSLIGVGYPAIQRIFRWKGETVVTARAPGANGILYRFDESFGIHDICHFVTVGTLESRRHHKTEDTSDK